jgi:hypothetical protein
MEGIVNGLRDRLLVAANPDQQVSRKLFQY